MKQIAKEFFDSLISKDRVAEESDFTYLISVEDGVNSFGIEDLASQFVDDAAFDNLDIYSDDEDGLENLRMAIHQSGLGVSTVSRVN
tara:strand:+ start:811 stop:1071 length:261 start_codon:yes stop_codon:yes gene_type:complete